MVRADRGIERDSGAFGADSGYCHLFYGCAKRYLWHMRDSCAAYRGITTFSLIIHAGVGNCDMRLKKSSGNICADEK